MDMYSYIVTWLTPTSLFLLLNLTIATIAISHRFHKPEKPTGIVRTRSLLDRVRSFNYTTTFQQQDQQHVTHHDTTSSHDEKNPSGIVRTSTPSLFERVMSFKHATEVDTSTPEKDTGIVRTAEKYAGIVRTPSMLSRLKSMDFSSLYRDVHHHHEVVQRSKSEKGEEEGRSEKVVIKKTVSERGMLAEENVDEGRRMEKTMSFGDDGGVDAKADDFINRFKQQLKLQRLDSLLRYKCNNNDN